MKQRTDNIHNDEKLIFEQKHKAAEFVGLGRTAISQALKTGGTLNKKYKVISVE